MLFLDVDHHVAFLVTLLRTVGTVEHGFLAALEAAVHREAATILVALAALGTLPAGVFGARPPIIHPSVEAVAQRVAGGARVTVVVVVVEFGVGRWRRGDEVGHVVDVDVFLPRREDLVLVVEELRDDLASLVLGHHRGVGYW